MKLFIDRLADVPNVDYLLIVTFGFFYSFSPDKLSNVKSLLEQKVRVFCEWTKAEEMLYNIIINKSQKLEVNIVSAKNLNLNANKISDIEEHIRAFNERKRKLIEQNKLTVYDMISEIYNLENQALVDAVTAEHQLIKKLTASGMTYEQIAEFADGYNTKTINQTTFEF